MPVRWILAATAVLLALGTAAGGGSAVASPVTVDVIAWPGEAAGPLQWKLWHVTASEPIRSLTLGLPPGAVRARALRALMSSPQVGQAPTVGSVAASVRESSDSIAHAEAPLVAGGCPGAAPGGLATLRFEVGPSCTTVALDGEVSGGVVVRITPAVGNLTALDLRLEALQTPAGRLLPGNPPVALTADTSAAVETGSGTAHDTVREIVGGTTTVVVDPGTAKVVYGQSATLTGRVTRAGSPAVGEQVNVGELFDSVANVPTSTIASATTGADGRFSVTIRPWASARWAAWARPAGVPRLNTLAGVAPDDLVVRAPRPAIERRHARRVASGLVRADIVVRNPIARLETMQCRLFVGGALRALRRFPAPPTPLVFAVTGHADARVRAVVGRWDGPPIAGRSSRVLRLSPRSARHP